MEIMQEHHKAVSLIQIINKEGELTEFNFSVDLPEVFGWLASLFVETKEKIC